MNLKRKIGETNLTGFLTSTENIVLIISHWRIVIQLLEYLFQNLSIIGNNITK